jgi:hypothetical protein
LRQAGTLPAGSFRRVASRTRSPRPSRCRCGARHRRRVTG